MERVIYFIITAALIQGVHGGDPCEPGHYKIISEGRRSTLFIPGPDDSLLCDNYRVTNGQWYRFEHRVGGMMPEHCIELFRCGTQAPIWLNGHHPTGPDEVVERQVCANFGDPRNNCCDWKANVLVKRCEGRENVPYFVYRLAQPNGCNIAYCAGDQVPCPQNLLFNDVTQKCEDMYPMMHNASLSSPIIEDEFIHFYCYLGMPTANEDIGAQYEVNFYSDWEKIVGATHILSYPLTSAKLEEKWLRGNLGTHLSCGVKTYWKNYPNYKSTEYFSERYYLGIIVEPHHLVVQETDQETSKIMLKSTLPPTCKNPEFQGRCEITVQVVTPRRLVASQSGDDSGYLQCKYRIARESWNENEWMAYNLSEPLEVVVKRDPYVNEASHQVIHFEPFPVGVPDYMSGENGSMQIHQNIWDEYQLHDITVDVEKDDQIATCHSTADPRIRTWDKGGFDILHRIGEFVLVRSNASRIYEVHVRHWLCKIAWFASCNCGVAVREGNVVLAVDMCEGRQNDVPRVKVTQTSADGNLRGASVTRDVSGKTFSINMPSGAYVKAEVHNWGMNIYAFSATEDVGLTEGLCGSFDGDAENDFDVGGQKLGRQDFIEAWRITPGQSLFDKRPEWSAALRSAPLEFCKCSEENAVTCDWREQIDEVADVGKPEIEVEPLIPKVNWDEDDRRKRRSLRFRRNAHSEENDELYTDNVDDEEDGIFDYGVDPLPTPDTKWPTPNGYTEEFARHFCEETLRNSSSYTICQEIVNMNVLRVIDNCVGDIQLMDDLEWALNVISEMEFECLVTSQKETPIGSTAPQEVIKFMCPNQCNGKGRCVDGVCHCFSGYDGAACHLVEGQPPVLKRISNNGLCDITFRPCRSVRVIAENVKDSSSLICSATQVEIIGGVEVIIPGTTVITSASMISFTEVSCVIPVTNVRQSNTTETKGSTSESMLISISNDGNSFSDEKLLVVYDSSCLDCSDVHNCNIKTDSCEINGHCFAPDEPNPENWCEVCDPLRTRSGFSHRTNNVRPQFVTPSMIRRVHGEVLTMPLEAEDPEGRPLTYVQMFTTSPTSVSVNNSGILTWHSNHNSTIRLEVRAYDECNLYTIGHFELSVMGCDCMNGGSCAPDPSHNRGLGHYICECVPGYAGVYCEREIDECDSNPCLFGACTDLMDGFICSCIDGYKGLLCDELEQKEENNVMVNPGGVAGTWGAWGPWTQCSHRCDVGLSRRHRICETLPCSDYGNEAKKCNEHNCPEDPTETENGVVLVLDEHMSEDTQTLLRVHELSILELVAIWINTLCKNSLGECCEVVEMDKKVPNEDVVTEENFYFGSGTPKVVGSKIIVRLLGKFDTVYLEDRCNKEPSQFIPSSGNKLMPSEILKLAASESKATILSAYDLNIDDVLLPEEYTAEYEESIERKSSSRHPDNLWLIIGLAAGGVVLLIIIFGVVCCVMRCPKNKDVVNANHARSNSRKYLTKNDQMDEIESPVADDKISKADDDKTNSTKGTANKFFYDYLTRQESNVEHDISVTPAASTPSTVKGKYFYKYAVNDGMAQVNRIDSSTLGLNTPGEVLDSASVDGITTEGFNVHFEPDDDEQSVNKQADKSCATNTSDFLKGGSRLSTRNRVMAWKLFSDN